MYVKLLAASHTELTLSVNHGIAFIFHQNSPSASKVPGLVVGTERRGMTKAQFLSSRSPDFWRCKFINKAPQSKVGLGQGEGQCPNLRVLEKLPGKGSG